MAVDNLLTMSDYSNACILKKSNISFNKLKTSKIMQSVFNI